MTGIAFGGIMVFNAQEIVNVVDQYKNVYVDETNNQLIGQQNGEAFPLSAWWVLTTCYVEAGPTDLSGVFREVNPQIDVRAEYELAAPSTSTTNARRTRSTFIREGLS